MGLFGDILQMIGLGYEVSKDQHLTGAQREANAFSAEQAEINRRFQAAQVESARAWQEDQYLKYNSPAALVRQYQDAGVNPAVMFGSSPTPASTAPSYAAGSAPSSVTPSGGDLIGMIGQMLEASTLGERLRGMRLQNERAEIENALVDAYGGKRADAEIRQIEQAINESVARTGEASTRSALNNAMSDLTKVQKNSEEFAQKRKEWEAKFIEDYHMTPELAGDLVKAAATLVGAGIMSATKLVSLLKKPTGTHTRSITERQGDGTTITDTFSGYPDM